MIQTNLHTNPFSSLKSFLHTKTTPVCIIIVYIYSLLPPQFSYNPYNNEIVFSFFMLYYIIDFDYKCWSNIWTKTNNK